MQRCPAIGAGRGPEGATIGDHHDLLDVIRESCGLVEFRDVANEAHHFLSLPRSELKSAGARP